MYSGWYVYRHYTITYTTPTWALTLYTGDTYGTVMLLMVWGCTPCGPRRASRTPSSLRASSRRAIRDVQLARGVMRAYYMVPCYDGHAMLIMQYHYIPLLPMIVWGWPDGLSLYIWASCNGPHHHYRLLSVPPSPQISLLMRAILGVLGSPRRR